MKQRSTKSYGRKFDVSKALKTSTVKFSRRKNWNNTEEYVKQHSRANGHVPTVFIINGKEVEL